MPNNPAYRLAKRIVITVVGFTVLLAGIVMIVLPGPAFVVIPVGLGILGLEFAWARVWLRKIKQKGEELARSARNAIGSHAPETRPPDTDKS
jgi:tellurite resistance protein TerC